ncbi:rhodanese-like domain-containing protein [Methylophilus aquaticus]|uniref:Rhodanese-like domain-containing protein n=1 Tax=Methylophilus aquaticus TaxID=1971610 RepID=A0ABT9JT91_9PROT|nr:rhodanese-like domain-containing protein [Methylophilus aquaticus]
MDFLKQNILLIGLALGSGITLLWPMLARAGAGSVLISVTEAVMLMSRNQPLILDVREPDEFAQGHLQGARNIPLAQLNARLGELQKFRDKPVLVVCQSGSRAKAACTLLKAEHFTALHQLQGGIQAWVSANMPLIK